MGRLSEALRSRWPLPTLSLRARIVLTYVALVVLANLSITLVAARSQSSARIEEAEHVLENQAVLISNHLEVPLRDYTRQTEVGDPAAAQTALINEIALVRPQRPRGLAVVLPDGTPVYHSLVPLDRVDNQLLRPEVAQAFNDLSIRHSVRPDPLTGEDRIFAAVVVEHEGQVYGLAQLSQPLVVVQREIYRGWLLLAAVSVAVFLISVGAGFWIGHQLLTPLERLRRTAHRIADGDLSLRADVRTDDELGQVASSFNHMVDRVAAMLDQQKSFVANASHELRTPLNNIRLRGEALLDGGLEDPMVARPFTEDIVGETARLGRIVGDLLELSRVERQLGSLERQPLYLEALWGEVLIALGPLVESAGLTVDFCPEDAPPVSAAPEAIMQVMTNLLDNAIKYSPTGGAITVRMGADDGGAFFSVADQGPGIPPADQPHIFERFYRGTTATDVGTGLGLSIVKSIVDAHGGTVSVDCGDVGTTFTVTLPGAEG
jgi:signal transduction histidine kinase